MATENKIPGCNGWAVVQKSKLNGDDGRNYHIVEVKIQKRNGNEDYIAEWATSTCCGLPLKQSANLANCTFYRNEQQDDFRIQLAKWQNKGYEFCGRCVGHFYKDPPQA